METTDATAARVGARSSFAERLVLAAVGVEGTGHVLELSDPKALQQREFRDIRDECESNCRGQRGSHGSGGRIRSLRQSARDSSTRSNPIFPKAFRSRTEVLLKARRTKRAAARSRDTGSGRDYVVYTKWGHLAVTTKKAVSGRMFLY